MMECATCSAANPVGSRFCNQCGARLEIQSVNAPQTRNSYTPKHLVERVLKDRSALLGERKRVTVLFADIKGSTQLAAQVGPEVWHMVLDRFFSLLSAAVHRYEGTVNQFTGDGVMALFGAPVAHEDHAQRAAHAALEMQSSVRKYADELRLEKGLNLNLRIGLNTGDVIVGRIGDDLRMDYTAQGLTVNLAARLEQICEPGQVYLSHATMSLIEREFTLRNLGATRIKGVEEPVDVFALTGLVEGGSGSQWRLRHGHEIFIGRDQQMATLQAAFFDACNGDGQSIALHAAAGMGKTRLCHEFLIWAKARGTRVHRAMASPYARHRPMAAPRELYLSRLGCVPGSAPEFVRERIAENLPEELRDRRGAFELACEFAGVGQSETLRMDLAASLRDPLLSGLAKYLPASEQVQIILFEDLQHLDQITLEFVKDLVAATAGTKTLLILSWRSDSRPLNPELIDRCIALPAMELALTEQLAAAWLGRHESVEGLAPRIAQRAAGNPFFVEEAILALADTGVLEGRFSEYRLLRAIADLPIPDTVHALIASRIDRLDPEHKALLHAASIIGIEFDAELLVGIEPSISDVEGALRTLCRLGFLRDLGRDVWEFVLPLSREVAYSTQLDSARANMHQKLAALIEETEGVRASQASARIIAEHWSLAGKWELAGHWSLLAGQWFATRDARLTVEQYQNAIENLDRAPHTPQSLKLSFAARAGLIRLSQILSMDSDEIDRSYAQALALAKDTDDAASVSELSISYGNALLQRGATRDAVALIEKGLRDCPDAVRAAMGARFRMSILLAFASVGRGDEGLVLVNWAAGEQWLTGEVHSENTLSRAFVSVQLAWSGQLDRARTDLVLAIAQSEADGLSASWMHGLLVDLAWFTGNFDGVMEASAKALEKAEAFGSDYFRVMALRARGQAHLLLDRPEDAVELLESARLMGRSQNGAHQFEAHTLAVLAEACQKADQLSAAEQWSRQAVQSGRQSNASLWELRAWIARLALPLDTLSAAEAEHGFTRARELCNAMGSKGIAPRLIELAALRESVPEQRRAAQIEAMKAYAAIGAEGHEARMRRQLDQKPA